MRHLLAAAVAAVLAGCALPPASPVFPEVARAPAPRESVCPPGLPVATRCYTGEDGVGSHYRIALPAHWQPGSGVLVLHAHDGPDPTGPARAQRPHEDLERWAIAVRAGHAWAGSSYRRGGHGMTPAAEDTERLRQIFVRAFGAPRRTLLHGHGWGAGVAAQAAERYATVRERRGPYDGVLLTAGVLGGGARAYEFLLDLRVVYQYFCRNHPRPAEAQYPLWMGLPAGSPLAREELAARADECTGVGRPVVERTEQQQARLAAILGVIRIPEEALPAHLEAATWGLQDLAQGLGGNPFSNVGATYHGSEQDETLNAGVLRYAADPAAQARLAADSTPTGRVNVPVLTLHGIDDPIAFVELETQYRDALDAAGTRHLLLQAFSDDADHDDAGDVQYAALLGALLEWADSGVRPTSRALAQRCAAIAPAAGQECRLLPGYVPAPLASRVAPRPR